MLGDPPGRVQRTKVAEQGAGAVQPGLGRRRQKRQIARRCPPDRKVQRQTGQVGGFDLGRGKGRQGPLFGPGPHPVGHSWSGPASPAPALVGLGAAHAFGHQPRHARPRVIAGAAGAAAVDDARDIRDGQRGFGDRGREHQFARPLGRQRGPLRRRAGSTVKPVQTTALGQARLEARRHACDLGRAGQKSQNAAFGVVKRALDQRRGLVFEPGARRQRPVAPAGLDRKRPARGGNHGRVVQKRCHRCSFQRCRHHQKHKIGSQRAARFPRQRQPQIRVQRAFVKLVEDDRADARQPGVALQHSGQDAFGHHLDARGFRHPCLAAYPIAHGLAHRFAQHRRHPLGGGARRQAARLEHHDAPTPKACVQHRQRHPRRLAGPRRRLQNRAAIGFEGAHQRRYGIVYGQAVGHRIVIRNRRGADQPDRRGLCCWTEVVAEGIQTSETRVPGHAPVKLACKGRLRRVAPGLGARHHAD